MKLSPLATAILGVVGGVLCLAFVVVAHRAGIVLTEMQGDLLIGGGAAALLGGVVGARFMPTKGESK